MRRPIISVIPKSDKRLEDTHFANYVDTWTQEGFPSENKFFLQNGANFFCADDHEFGTMPPILRLSSRIPILLRDARWWKSLPIFQNLSDGKIREKFRWSRPVSFLCWIRGSNADPEEKILLRRTTATIWKIGSTALRESGACYRPTGIQCESGAGCKCYSG